MKYLGIDTSNYRTSAALFDPADGQWQNENQLLTVPAGAIGLRQSEALYQHTLRLQERIAALPAGVGRALGAIGVSTRPRAVEGSYMPCFLAGENVARSMAHLLGIPIFACSHQQGHIAAAVLSAAAFELLDKPFYAWHLSGGTSELLLVEPGDDGLPQARRIGGSNDLAAGQLLDRAGQMLGLPFPSGAMLDALACDAVQVRGFPVKVRACEFSLSGMENRLQEMARRQTPPAEVARYALETLANAVCKATEQAIQARRLPLLCAGGVMSSQILRARMHAAFDAVFAEPALSGDNAVGAAVLAARRNGEELCKAKYIP